MPRIAQGSRAPASSSAQACAARRATVQQARAKCAALMHVRVSLPIAPQVDSL